jgi:hypothetical protein
MSIYTVTYKKYYRTNPIQPEDSDNEILIYITYNQPTSYANVKYLEWLAQLVHNFQDLVICTMLLLSFLLAIKITILRSGGKYDDEAKKIMKNDFVELLKKRHNSK